jgi:hypothetical protein
MNFDNMPELHWHYGYGYCYVLFVGVVLLALLLMWYNGLIKVGTCLSWGVSTEGVLGCVCRKRGNKLWRDCQQAQVACCNAL